LSSPFSISTVDNYHRFPLYLLLYHSLNPESRDNRIPNKICQNPSLPVTYTCFVKEWGNNK
jgi:hypothetical protein